MAVDSSLEEAVESSFRSEGFFFPSGFVPPRDTHRLPNREVVLGLFLPPPLQFAFSHATQEFPLGQNGFFSQKNTAWRSLPFSPPRASA